MKKQKGRAVWMLSAGTLAMAIGVGSALRTEQLASANAPQKDAATERARREVKMLDDIYKTSIVLITTHYVDGKESLPAGSAFKALFAAVKEKGWHEVRLLDATGDPYEPNNAPKAGFETRAVKKLVEGQAYYDEVVTEQNKKFLLAATPIPVVMDKCVLCHDNYKDVKAGKPIGAIGYKVPILD
jgi:hypothetical protein